MKGLWTGIEKHGAGYRARVSQGRDLPRLEQYFPAGTDPREMQAWRQDTQASIRVQRKQRASMGTLAGDVARYLRIVTALPTLKDRKRELQAWVDVFGTARRASITPGQIRAVRDRWLTEPRADKKPPLAPGTVNKRLRALSNLYAVLDGKNQPNPVRSVPEAREPDPEPRALTYDVIAAIIDHMPDAGRPEKGKKQSTLSETKIRVRCLAYCQLTHSQLAKLTPADLDLDHARIRLPARAKGKGAAAIWSPMLPEAVDAFRDFTAADLWGKFSRSSLRRSFNTAAKNAGVTGKVRPYDLRHSYATLAYRATGSLEAVGKLLQHASASTTRRYALAAEAQVLAEHGATVGQHFGATVGGNTRKQTELRGGSVAPLRPIPRGKKPSKQP